MRLDTLNGIENDEKGKKGREVSGRKRKNGTVGSGEPEGERREEWRGERGEGQGVGWGGEGEEERAIRIQREETLGGGGIGGKGERAWIPKREQRNAWRYRKRERGAVSEVEGE